MKPQTMTLIFIIVWVAILVGYDLFVFVRWGREATITAVVEDLVVNYPGFALILSFIAGSVYTHLFLGNSGK